MSASDKISKHFKIVSLTDPTYSQGIGSDFDLSTMNIGTVLKHNIGNKYIKTASRVFDRLPNDSLSKTDLPYELALSDRKLYLILTNGSFNPRSAYSASQIQNSGIISGETPTSGSYYCIGCVKFEDLSNIYYNGGCGCGCGWDWGNNQRTVVINTKYLSLFVRYL